MIDDDSRLRAFFADAHRDDPVIPFRRVAPRRVPAIRAARAWPRFATALCASIVLLATVAILRTPPPPSHVIASPLKGWHGPTDFLLANRSTHTHTDFLLRTPTLSPESSKGAPQ